VNSVYYNSLKKKLIYV